MIDLINNLNQGKLLKQFNVYNQVNNPSYFKSIIGTKFSRNFWVSIYQILTKHFNIDSGSVLFQFGLSLNFALLMNIIIQWLT